MLKRAANASPFEEYNHTMFITLEASKRYTLKARNRTFINEKGFEHPKDLFRKEITNKGWRELCKTPKANCDLHCKRILCQLG